MLIKPVSLSPAHPALAPASPALRRIAAAVLHAAGRRLQWLARRLAAAPSRPQRVSALAALEFHAEAGAPEGALYVDGQLVAHLPGVSRL